jgi:diguanylate cyclase (GGDEF)-like protein
MTILRSARRLSAQPIGANLSILLVEDQRSLALLLAAMLEERWGCQVVITHSLQEAKTLLSGNFSLAICDLNLPDAANGEIIDTLNHADLPIIAITGSFGEELRQTILGKGVVDYVLKQGIDALNYVSELVGRLLRNQKHTVLVVDDTLSMRTMLNHHLQRYQLNVLMAQDADSALEILNTHPEIRLMLTDYQMPGKDGIQLTVEVRRRWGKDQLAIIGISSSQDPFCSARFIKHGANDFIHKPFYYEELICRVHQNLEMLELVEENQRAANFDHLTGLANRRRFFHEGMRRLQQVQQAGQHIAVAMIDIDHFKRVNDTWGHDCGDHVLRITGKLLQDLFGDHLPARLGGEEFAVLFLNLPLAELPSRLEKLRQQMAETPFTWEDNTLTITLSIGMVIGPFSDLDTALRIADSRLYHAKRSGRNRIVASDPSSNDEKDSAAQQ